MEWMELTQEKECVLISMCGIFVVDAGFRIKQSDGVWDCISVLCYGLHFRLLLWRRWWEVRFHFRRQPCLKNAWCCFSAAEGKHAQEMKSAWKWRKNERQKVEVGWFEKRGVSPLLLSASLIHLSDCGLPVFFDCAEKHISFFTCRFPLSECFLKSTDQSGDI